MKKLALVTLFIVLLMGQVVSAEDEDLSLVAMTWQRVFEEDSIEDIRYLIESYPDWSEPYVMMVYYWVIHPELEGFEENALNSVELAKDFVGDNDLTLMEFEARIQIQLGNFVEAERILLDLVNRYPIGENVYRYLHTIYMEQNRLDDALAINNLAQRIYPLIVPFIYAKQEVYELQDSTENFAFLDLLLGALSADEEEALNMLRDAVALAAESNEISDFDEALALYWLTVYLQNSQDISANLPEINVAIERMIALVPDWDLPYLEQALVLLRQQEEETALDVLNETIDAFHLSHQLYYYRGQILEAMGDEEAAKADYWAYGQFFITRHVDYSSFNLINQNTPIPTGGGWHVNFSIEAEKDSLFSFHTVDRPFGNYLIALLDEEGNPIAIEFYEHLEEEGITLSLNIPSDGTYSLVIVNLLLNGFPIYDINAIISLE